MNDGTNKTWRAAGLIWIALFVILAGAVLLEALMPLLKFAALLKWIFA